VKNQPPKLSSARITFTVETNCPYCEYYNRYHDLTAVHGNMRRVVAEYKEPSVNAKCQQCDKVFVITAYKYA
jgi:hypothetical protein